MSVFLEILNGPRKGAQFRIEAGLRIGRKRGEIRLEDPKISSEHAHIEFSGSGFVLLDQNSANGVRVGGQRVKSVQLTAGAQFQLGDTSFQVVEISDVPRQNEIESVRVTTPQSWREILKSWLVTHQNEMSDQPLPISAFTEPLELHVVKGPQHKTVWAVGYGPRRFGASTPEFAIAEEQAPAQCFELIPSGRGVIFKTNFADQVQLNGQSVGQAYVKNGDWVVIGQTTIEIRFRKAV